MLQASNYVPVLLSRRPISLAVVLEVVSAQCNRLRDLTLADDLASDGMVGVLQAGSVS